MRELDSAQKQTAQKMWRVESWTEDYIQKMAHAHHDDGAHNEYLEPSTLCSSASYAQSKIVSPSTELRWKMSKIAIKYNFSEPGLKNKFMQRWTESVHINKSAYK